jgi:hypothetical protein
VAADLASLLPFVGGAVAAIGGGVAAAWLQGKSQERIEQRRLHHEECIERQQRRDRAAEVLAEVSALLRDSSVQRTLAEHLPEEAVKTLRFDTQDLQPRQKAAREQLILMAIREPSPEVRCLARELEKALDNSLHSTSYKLASRSAASRSAGKAVAPILAKLAADSEQDHFKALALLDELVEKL